MMNVMAHFMSTYQVKKGCSGVWSSISGGAYENVSVWNEANFSPTWLYIVQGTEGQRRIKNKMQRVVNSLFLTVEQRCQSCGLKMRLTMCFLNFQAFGVGLEYEALIFWVADIRTWDFLDPMTLKPISHSQSCSPPLYPFYFPPYCLPSSFLSSPLSLLPSFLLPHIYFSLPQQCQPRTQAKKN